MRAEWTARLGVMIPSGNAVFERDARMVLPQTITAHFARMKLTRDEPDQLSGLIDHVPGAAGDLGDAGVDAIAFACTTGSLDGGLGYDRRIAEIIERESGVRATTTSTAVVEAFRALDARRLTIVSPYEPWLNEKVRSFLVDSGFEVAGVEGFSLPEPRGIEAVTPGQIAAAVRALDEDEVDAHFISCTDFRGVEAASLLGDELGKPVVSSNQATLWRLLAMVGRVGDARGLGALVRLTAGGEVAAWLR